MAFPAEKSEASKHVLRAVCEVERSNRMEPKTRASRKRKEEEPIVAVYLYGDEPTAEAGHVARPPAQSSDVAAVASGTANVIAKNGGNKKATKLIKQAIDKSTQLYRRKEYDEALKTAEEALSLASVDIPGKPEHLQALMHLSSVYVAVRKFEKALPILDELLTLTAKIHGHESVRLIDALHAKAEVLESMEVPLAQPVEQLSRARDIRRSARGPDSIDAANASFNLASLLMRGAHDEDVSMRLSQRAGLVSQAAELGHEACSIASAHGDQERVAEFAEELLELLGPDGSAAAASARTMLRSAYYEVRTWTCLTMYMHTPIPCPQHMSTSASSKLSPSLPPARPHPVL